MEPPGAGMMTASGRADGGEMRQTGGCLCGAVRYTAEDVEPDVHACHCSMCRRWTGGPGLAAGVGSVRFEGSEHIGRYDSSAWAERGFCTRCGANLFYRLKPRDHYVLWLGTFDDPAPFRLASEIYVDAKPSCYAFAGDHPRLTEAEFLASLES
jgi:hypothetical protein